MWSLPPLDWAMMWSTVRLTKRKCWSPSACRFSVEGRIEVDEVDGLGVHAAHDLEAVAGPDGAGGEVGLTALGGHLSGSCR